MDLKEILNLELKTTPIDCCNGTAHCPGKGEKHWCELQTHKPILVAKPIVYDRAEALELVYLYAKDILAFWPDFSFKKVPMMVKKMDALKQAIEAVK